MFFRRILICELIGRINWIVPSCSLLVSRSGVEDFTGIYTSIAFKLEMLSATSKVRHLLKIDKKRTIACVQPLPYNMLLTMWALFRFLEWQQCVSGQFVVLQQV